MVEDERTRVATISFEALEFDVKLRPGLDQMRGPPCLSDHVDEGMSCGHYLFPAEVFIYYGLLGGFGGVDGLES